MRVIFLRKKLELLTEPQMEGDIVVYHGTNLANLYLIARSGFLGSPVGFHTGSLERVGRFYVTTSEIISFNLVALGYARYIWPAYAAEEGRFTQNSAIERYYLR
jgi:hypothetical protein